MKVSTYIVANVMICIVFPVIVLVVFEPGLDFVSGVLFPGVLFSVLTGMRMYLVLKVRAMNRARLVQSPRK